MAMVGSQHDLLHKSRTEYESSSLVEPSEHASSSTARSENANLVARDSESWKEVLYIDVTASDTIGEWSCPQV